MQDQLERVKNRALFIIFIIENNNLLLIDFILEKNRERETMRAQ